MTPKKKSVVAAGGAAAVVLAAFAAPGAAASESIDGDVQVSNTETVSVLMDADGSVNTQRVYEQLVLSGQGSVDISNPVSTDGLRNLDGFGGWEVVDGAQRVKTEVNGKEKFRSVASFDGELPVSLDVKYYLDGEPVEPGDVVGESGELEVVYTVVNTTGKQQEVTYLDGEGNTKTSTQAVVIPMVGSLTTVLPSSFRDVEPVGANAAGDGKGGTQLSFTMTLFPPIGADRATFGYRAQVEDGVVPKASLSLLPVNPLENASFKGGAESYKGGADKGVDLTAGAVTIDENLLKIRDGAADLVDGLLQLRDGSQELNAGLAGKAAPGAGKLSAGAGQLNDGVGTLKGGTSDLDAGASKLRDGATQLNEGAGELDAGAGKLKAGAGDLNRGAGDLDAGAGKLRAGAGDLSAGATDLNTGAGELADGLAKASAGGPELLAGVSQLEEGAAKLDAGLKALNDGVTAGGTQFKNTFAATVDTTMAGVAQQLSGSVNGALDNLTALVQSSATMSDQEKAVFSGNVAATKTALGNGITGALTGQVAPGLKAGVNDGVDQITGAVSNGVGAPATPDTLRNGTAQLSGGLALLSEKGGELADGLGLLSEGANKLSAGTGQLEAGAGALSQGANELKDGTGRLKGGASQLAAGSSDLKDGTGRLKGGASQLATGTGDLKAGTVKLDGGAAQLAAGTSELAAGAAELASGLRDAADGSGRLAEGLGTAAESAPALPEGAEQLSEEGTSQLVNVGNGTAMDFGLKYALIEAGAARAAEAQPYGSPADATALTAYKFDLAAADGQGSANATRGIAVAILAAAALGLMALRRRGVLG